MDDHNRAKRQIKLKATLKEVHLGGINPTSSFEEMKQEVQSWFPLLSDQEVNLDLVYKDEDGDDITIETEEEWKVFCGNSTGNLLKLSIRAKPVIRRKPSFSESTKSGCSTVSILRNINSVDNSQTSRTETRNRNSSTLEVETSHQASSSFVMQASDDDISQRNRNQTDFSPPATSPTLDEGPLNFSFSKGQIHSSDEEDDVFWPPSSGDTLDKVKITRPPNINDVDSRARNMTHFYPSDKKGRVLIFNQKKFTSEPDILGDFDTTCLCLLFRALKYDVQSYTDQSVQQIRQKLDKEKELLAKTEYGCYIVIILTHYDPKTKSLSGSRGDTISLDEITDRLKEEETLKGVPKLVFLDGARHDFPGSLPKFGGAQSRMTLKMPVATGADLPWSRQGVDSTDSCPSNKMDDFYIYIAGTLGEGNPIYKGSLMIQALVKVFCANLYKDSLCEMMMKVEQLLGEARTRTYKFQMPQVMTNTLKKEVYFDVET